MFISSGERFRVKFFKYYHFFSFTKPIIIRFSKLGLTEKELCNTRECYYYMPLIKLRQQNQYHKMLSCFFFFFANAVIVRFTKLDFIFLKYRTRKYCYNHWHLISISFFQIFHFHKVLSAL